MWEDGEGHAKRRGQRRERMKALFWEGDGFLLLYKRLENGAFQWPKTTGEIREITYQ
ncbi:IS66 family insertion sequence element accessory protein TnpB [Maledivibacter halophilus]|uniref:IS66 family insertion sequence element accessory protein TnpB n=1 Tax=Maledivibacter halophilus TaxID=36842 RepID=UPI0038BA3CA4